GFPPGHRGGPGGGSGDAAADQGQLSPAWHRRRGVRQRARGRRICLGARSDRRHQVLYRGLSIWGTLIALMHRGTPVFGMMHQPYIGERFSGDSGSAQYSGPSGERKLSVRRCASLKEATSFTTSPLLMNTADREAFGRVENQVRLTRYGGDCYSYCMLAAGHLDLVIETELKPYDIA